MEYEGNMLEFFLTYENLKSVIQLSEYDTVELLKIEIHRKFDIPPHKQVIEGWKSIPENDNYILQTCANNECVTNLSVKRIEDLEVEASFEFISKIFNVASNCGIVFHTCRLIDAINEACFAPIVRRKALLLYFHNEKDKFSHIFCENLKRPEVTTILNRSFFLLGWDVEADKYKKAFQSALNSCSDLSDLTTMVNSKVSAALVIVPIKNSLTIYSCLRAKVSNKDILTVLTNAENFLITENEQELKLEQINIKTSRESDMNSSNYQKLMADMLGDRDYDSFEFDEHEHLKNKIAFALLGPPQKEEGYEEKQMKKVKQLYTVILENSNEIAKYNDKVEVSFIYNCTEPLPTEKVSRAKKFKDYNPNTDLSPLPVFILRKCRGSPNPCRIFIDDTGRTYETWHEYISRNKLHECEMVLPLNGRYEVNGNGNVLLERHLSPACGVDTKLLQGADYLSTAGGLVSGGIFLAAAIPAIPVAPVALIAGGVIGIGVGIYSIGRSAYTLYDRSRHKETLSFANSEARGAYFNIIAGSLGFVGAGANMAVSQLAARGVNIGKGAGAVVNTIGIANISASGVSVLNSGYDVFDQWINENQTPSMLTIVQLSSSILFFGNAVYNFKTCSTIIEETQARTLQDYQESLRSNRHRKTFNKLLKETVRQNNGNEVRGKAEVISAIRNIPNKDEVFGVLTRSNKNMNKNGVKFSANNGDITLNGYKIDMNEFASMNKQEVNTLLLNLPAQAELTPVETLTTRQLISNTFNNIPVPDMDTIINYTFRIMSSYNSDIKTKIISALAALLAKLTRSVFNTLDEIFPDHSKYINLINMIVRFFSRSAEHLEEQYEKWKDTGDDKYYNPIFQHININKTKRVMEFFEKGINIYYIGTNLTEAALKELVTYFYNWLAKQICEYQENKEKTTRRRLHSAAVPMKKICCSVCQGYYFVKRK